ASSRSGRCPSRWPQREAAESSAYPIAPFTFLQDEFLSAYLNSDHRLQGIDVDLKRFCNSRRSFSESIVRTNQPAAYSEILDLHGKNLPTFHCSRGGGRIIRVKGEGTVGTPQIGRPHARQGFAFSRDWREIGGNAKHGVRNTVLIEDFPKGFSLPKLFGASCANRNYPAANVNGVFRPFDSGSRKV